MPTNLERAHLVARNVQIESVTLVRSSMETTLDPLDSPEELRVSQQYRCRHDLGQEGGRLLVAEVSLVLQARDASAPENTGRAPAFDVSATFHAAYRLQGAESFPEDALQHFADLNGTYNVWPYWRELVQTFTCRAGLGAFVVPVYTPRVREVPVPEELSLPADGPGP